MLVVARIPVKSKLSGSFAGLFSLVWVGVGFPFFYVVFEPYVAGIDLKWPLMLGLLSAWIGVGIGLGICGLRRGNVVGRVSGLLTLVASAVAAWVVLSPLFISVRYRGQMPNKPDRPNAAMTPLCQSGVDWRGIGALRP